MHILVFYILYFTAGTQTKSRLFLAPGMDIKAFLEFMDPGDKYVSRNLVHLFTSSFSLMILFYVHTKTLLFNQ